MSKRIERKSSVRIYVIQYSIFLIGAMLFITGLYLYDIGIAQTEQGLNGRVREISGIISIVCGIVCVVLSYIYARVGARIIGTNCPYCYGSGYVDIGVRKQASKEICPVCNGTGKMYDKAKQQFDEYKKKESKQMIETKETLPDEK